MKYILTYKLFIESSGSSGSGDIGVIPKKKKIKKSQMGNASEVSDLRFLDIAETEKVIEI